MLIECIHTILNKQNLTEVQINSVTADIVDPTISSSYKAAIFEGLRLKEESALENKCFQDFL